MNIKIQGTNNIFGNRGMKSVQDRMETQAKRDNQIAFLEQRKSQLKYMKTDSIEDISRKLEMLHDYDDQIAAAKKAYNNSQVFHVLDEARERGEKIAEMAEKFAPKTAEERHEDIIEEATGVEKSEGMLGNILEELEEVTEEVTEEMTEELKEMSDEALSETNMEKGVLPGTNGIEGLSAQEIAEKYKRIDYRI
ncbi:MAG: hypothetical protein IJT37_09345 [Lachnospiraceae bacterium]|nr:hypothetical protein [Lachnospiraceae bacterium]